MGKGLCPTKDQGEQQTCVGQVQGVLKFLAENQGVNESLI